MILLACLAVLSDIYSYQYIAITHLELARQQQPTYVPFLSFNHSPTHHHHYHHLLIETCSLLFREVKQKLFNGTGKKQAIFA